MAIYSQLEVMKFSWENLSHHFRVKFYDELNGDGFEAQKRFLGPEMGN